ncbi:MAG: hypothetical protein WAN35_14810 [Terracidiphilus sp.]
MKIPKSLPIVGWIFLSFAVFWAWYMVAADYSYSAVSGTYVCRMNREKTILVLKEDHSFQEDISRQGKLLHAEGIWHRSGEGGIDFSKEFIKVSGEEVHANGTAWGYIYKSFGLLFSITLAPDPGGPRFHKKLFR